MDSSAMIDIGGIDDGIGLMCRVCKNPRFIQRAEDGCDASLLQETRFLFRPY
jgi:hypothetical protein